MAIKSNMQDSHFTSEVRNLIKRVNDHTIQGDSVLDRAIDFFKKSNEIKENISGFEQQISSLNSQNQTLSFAKKKANKDEIEALIATKEVYCYQLKAEGQIRHNHLKEVSYQLIDLCEGENFDETLRKSAQFLGTLQLISPIEGKYVASVNERHKAVYKAVLCLRLLDELILSGQVDDPYVNKFLDGHSLDKYRNFCISDNKQYSMFIELVKLPLVMAALLQDVGNFHPDAQLILLGDSGKLDPYRTLELEDRKALLQISYREIQYYISEGLSELNYVGNSKDDKQVFIKNEKDKMVFIKRILKSAISPKLGLGNLLKVPQIYTSIILSTKSSYNYKVLPKVFNVLNLNAERGACQQSVVDSLYKITGMFPQGYGVSYIPKAVDNSDMDFYEYAIVSQFYPEIPEEPICRQATRNLAFISYGHDVVIAQQSNLHFHETAKRFSRVSKKRLLEILEQLVSNFEERKNHDILPRCWLPNDYFSVKNHQKLWNRVVQ